MEGGGGCIGAMQIEGCIDKIVVRFEKCRCDFMVDTTVASRMNVIWSCQDVVNTSLHCV